MYNHLWDSGSERYDKYVAAGSSVSAVSAVNVPAGQYLKLDVNGTGAKNVSTVGDGTTTKSYTYPVTDGVNTLNFTIG